MATAERRSRVGRNTFAQLIGRGSWLAASIFLTPYLFQNLGLAVFGVWSLLSGTVTIAMLTDFGLSPALIREVASGSEKGSIRRTRQALGLGFLAFIGFACLLMAAAVVLANPLDQMLGLSLGSELDSALLATAGAAAILGLSVPFIAVLDGHQRMDLSAIANGVGAIAWTAVTIYGIETGHGLVAPAMGLLAHSGSRGLVGLIFVLSKFPDHLPSFGRPEPGLIGDLFGFGIRVQASHAAAIVNSEADRWLIAAIATPAILAPYEIAIKLVAFARLVPGFVLAALFPVASAVHGAGDRAELDRIYLRTTRYLALSSALGAAILFAGAESAIVAWIGEPLDLGRDALWILVPAAGFNLCTGGASLITRAEGHPGRETRYAVLSMVMNIILTIPLIIAFGALGAIAGSSIAIVLASIYFFWKFHRSSQRPHYPIVHLLTRIWGVAIVAAGTGLAYSVMIDAPTDRLEGLISLTGITALTGLTFVAALTAMRFWDETETNRFSRLLGRMPRPTTHPNKAIPEAKR